MLNVNSIITSDKSVRFLVSELQSSFDNNWTELTDINIPVNKLPKNYLKQTITNVRRWHKDLKRTRPGIPTAKFSKPFAKYYDYATLSDDDLEIVIDRLDYTIAVVGDLTDEWIPVKRFLQRSLPKDLRKYISCVDIHTRKQKPNDFDYACMNYWKEKTGRSLFIPENKLHKDHLNIRFGGWNQYKKIYEKLQKNHQKTYGQRKVFSYTKASARKGNLYQQLLTSQFPEDFKRVTRTKPVQRDVL